MTNPGSEQTIERAQPRRSALLAFAGLFLVLSGPVIYQSLIDVPFLRSSGLPLWIMMGGGALLSLWAAMRDRRMWVGMVAGASTVLTLGMVFVFTQLTRVPAAPAALAAERIDDFSVPDENGKTVALAEVRGRGPALLVFYRGFW